ncbi:peptide/nickel transport system ATP-binding protein [Shimia marina]|uniref:Glutathione import ATP-binding protein GsiA n=2 Tax=Shimia marina TaxID=321267 RepID=A0A0P1EPY0_9RHOB|nr:Glutathione import ATP-binding protein GsiA [Shimia marina]SFE71981.1 peptide/nickel transport system ATP-binding protein [Shimia marina]
MMEKLLSVRDLNVAFETHDRTVEAVSGVSFDVAPGEVLGLVGESGSGKSVTGRSLMRLNPNYARFSEGSSMVINSDGGPVDILSLKGNQQLRKVRGDLISMIFQEPIASFAPALTIGKQMTEQLMLHRGMSYPEARELSIDMLDRVGITMPEKRIDQYAFELSGGMRQRAMIATALSTRPKLLIADEPTTALDVTIQAQVLKLMKELIAEFGMGVIFITHDLAVISEIADRVAVMQKGKILEQGTVDEVIRAPQHAYTKRLLAAVPRIDESILNAPAKPVKTEGDTDKPIVSVKDLTIQFSIGKSLLGRHTYFTAVDKVSFDIPKGSFFGLVGESGSGKTTAGRSMLKINNFASGSVTYDDGDVRYDIGSLKKAELKDYRSRAQLIFQDPYAALSPRMTVRDIIAEPLEMMKLTKNRSETNERVKEIARLCKLDVEHLRRFPHAFSGGQRQRIAIARALVSRPKFIIADEAVAALDVSIQAEILDLLKSLQKELGLTILFISHDLAVVANLCDHTVVMQQGKVVESAPTPELFRNPQRDYTKALLAAAPVLRAG